MVEGTGLENQQRGDPFVGSNPTASATREQEWALLPASFRPSSDAPTMSAPCGKRTEDLFGRRLPIRSSIYLELNGVANLKYEDDLAHRGCSHVDDQEAEIAHVAERSNPSTSTTSFCREPVGAHGVTCLCETQPNFEGRV